MDPTIGHKANDEPLWRKTRPAMSSAAEVASSCCCCGAAAAQYFRAASLLPTPETIRSQMVPLNLALLRCALSSQGRFWWDLMGLQPTPRSKVCRRIRWSSREATQPSHDHHRARRRYLQLCYGRHGRKKCRVRQQSWPLQIFFQKKKKRDDTFFSLELMIFSMLGRAIKNRL